MTVAMAFDHFARESVDFAVIEVGLGGRIDSTNVISPEACLITNIGLDHMDMLGDTLPLIAAEKAGIIKSNTPVVISETHLETLPVFKERAAECESEMLVADSLSPYPFETVLKGRHQQKNLQGVVALTHVLHDRGWNISVENIKSGLLNVVSNTGLKGRWQVLNNKTLTVCDTAHNKEALSYIIEEIEHQKFNELYLVLGFVQGKEVEPILELFPKGNFIFTSPNVPRALPLDELKDICNRLDIDGEFIPNVNEAIALAESRAKYSDMIYIGGSTFVVAEIENL